MKTFQELIQWLNVDRISYTGNGVIVAVLDSGVSKTHPLLQGKIIEHIDVTGDGSGDVFGHGTAVSSLIAAMAPDVKILDIKVLKDNGNGDFSTLMRGCEIAMEKGAHILNMSMAGGQDCLQDGTVARFLNTVANSGRILIAAAGNEGPEISPRLPAQAKNVVAVGAVQSDKDVAIFSSRGPVCDTITYPDCSAPGVDVQIATLNGGTDFGSGTSFACPIVSGIIACVVQKINGTLLRDQLELLLKKGCFLIGETKDNDTGWGRIDAYNAINIFNPGEVVTPAPIRDNTPLIIGGLAIAAAGAIYLMGK